MRPSDSRFRTGKRFKIKEKSIKKVLLKPFMLVAGVHALEDMASDSDDSWKSILEKNDIDVDLQIVGLGQVKEIQDYL
jgi:sirohydrochlorin cobaltochelatase